MAKAWRRSARLEKPAFRGTPPTLVNLGNEIVQASGLQIADGGQQLFAQYAPALDGPWEPLSSDLIVSDPQEIIAGGLAGSYVRARVEFTALDAVTDWSTPVLVTA